MPKQQLDLLPEKGLSITPDPERTEPRLWVRRLVVWREPGGEVVRDISLRPGLNIIWSPGARETVDRDTKRGVIGHGSGKTLFCRLLRHCLGERRFAPEDQRESIGTVFMEGIVGAEIMLDGVCWAIARPLSHRQRHMAVANGDLDEIAAGDSKHTGIEPFIEASEKAFFTKESSALVPEGKSWLTQLAWLTRDQDCRLDHVLNWRDASSGSESPVQGRSNENLLIALRVFLQAMTPGERDLGNEIRELEKEQKKVEDAVGYFKWEIEQKRSRLIQALPVKPVDLEDAPMEVETFKHAARKNLAEVASVTSETRLADPEPLRVKKQEATAKAEELSRQIARDEATVIQMQKHIEWMRAEIPTPFQVHQEENPICEICETPIDQVLADKCKLSHKFPDTDAIRTRREKQKQDLEAAEQELRTLKETLPNLRKNETTARQEAEIIASQIKSFETALKSQADKWYEARRLVDDANRFGELLGGHAETKKRNRALDGNIKAKRETMGKFRDKQARIFGHASNIFNAIIQVLIGETAKGTIRLTGNGLELKMQMGGERSTAAIESLKILAFDLTALCLGMEQGATLPTFLLHDSPREADLDIDLYHRLFTFVKSLEQENDSSLFQYIVTTTTPPPNDLQDVPWTRLKLKGAPADERLLRCDL